MQHPPMIAFKKPTATELVGAFMYGFTAQPYLGMTTSVDHFGGMDKYSTSTIPERPMCFQAQSLVEERATGLQ